MKYTHKLLAVGGASAFLMTAAPTFALDAAGGPLDDLLSSAATATVQATESKVENLSLVPGNKKATLMWDPVSVDGSVITKYEISYGTKSVEENLAIEYEKSMKIELDPQELETLGVARSAITNLSNGEKYFFAVRAITKDGEEAPYSDEMFTTPTMVSGDTQTTEEAENPDFELSESVALTTNIIKLTFSKPVVLPETTLDRKNLFRLNTKEDEMVLFEIEDVVLKTNYFLEDESDMDKLVTEDTEVYIVSAVDLEKEKEYQVTVSARLKDVDGDGIDNGVTDNLFFEGTDSVEIPEEEKPEEIVVASEGTTDPLVALFASTTPKATETEKEEVPKETEKEVLHSAPNDEVSPEDVTALQAKLTKRVKDFLVTLTWEKSKNTAGDLVKQLLYTSDDDGKTWADAKEYGVDITTHSFAAQPETNYAVKVTTQDRSGNESDGVITHIKVPKLASSGAPLFLALGLAMMGGSAQLFRRKKS